MFYAQHVLKGTKLKIVDDPTNQEESEEEETDDGLDRLLMHHDETPRYTDKVPKIIKAEHVENVYDFERNPHKEINTNRTGINCKPISSVFSCKIQTANMFICYSNT